MNGLAKHYFWVYSPVKRIKKKGLPYQDKQVGTVSLHGCKLTRLKSENLILVYAQNIVPAQTFRSW